MQLGDELGKKSREQWGSTCEAVVVVEMEDTIEIVLLKLVQD